MSAEEVVVESSNWLYLASIALVLAVLVYFIFTKLANLTTSKTTTNTIQTPAKQTIKKKPVAPVDDSKPRVTLFFGSQTGTAEDFANTLAEEARQMGFSSRVLDMEDYDTEDLSSEKFIVFCIATYGEGEPPDNAKEFHDWLIQDHPSDLLKGIQYTVFGLGNKTYEFYNAMGKLFNKRLEELGASRIYQYGEGDDDASLEEDFEKWKTDMWVPIAKHFGLSGESVETGKIRRMRAVYLKEHKLSVEEIKRGKFGKSHKSADIKNPYLATIVAKNELHGAASDRSCLHIELSIDPMIKYEPGDHVGIYPENDDEIVEAVAKRLGADLDAIISIYGKDAKVPILGPISVRGALKSFCDLTTAPRKKVLAALAELTDVPEHKSRLLLLADTAATEYDTWIKRDERTILEVLNEFPSVKLDLDYFIELVPRLAARMYSISSSPKKDAGRVSITAVVVEYKTLAGRIHHGVATTWLKAQPIKSQVPIFIRKSHFRLPKSAETPVIMVGPGTGLAPFRGFIRHLSLVEKKPLSILYFGCRGKDVDYIYRDELLAAQEDGTLSQLHVAFSREGLEKVYVQHLLLKNAEETWNLMATRKAHFYICGDAKAMAKDVQKALETIAREQGKLSEAEVAGYVKKLQEEGRWSTDVWS